MWRRHGVSVLLMWFAYGVDAVFIWLRANFPCFYSFTKCTLQYNNYRYGLIQRISSLHSHLESGPGGVLSRVPNRGPGCPGGAQGAHEGKGDNRN